MKFSWRLFFIPEMKQTREQGIKKMLDEILTEARLTQSLTGIESFSEEVMSAMAFVPRDEFVPADLRFAAFENGPLPIGHGQTISQPYIVALMSDLLGLQAEDKVLEIGTGSGYQTAVLSRLCRTVYSMDVIATLAETAQRQMQRLQCDNVIIKSGNGYLGWAEHAPYDAIIVTAAAPYIPQALIDQLKPGGRLVIPVGLQYMPQELVLIEKEIDGRVTEKRVLGVAFVPLVDDVVH
jgi:protein-L-isoaspartate(D-aspartate) O-methyltransferase